MKKTKQNLTVNISSIKDLFVAPTQDPFSQYEYIQTGEAALERAIRYINIEKYKHILNLSIYLPLSPAKLPPVTEIRNMIHYYLNLQLKEIAEKLMLFKRNTVRIFRNAVIFLLLCMSIVTLIGMESFLPNLPPLVRTVLVEGFTVIGWVVFWRPIELFLNEWTSLTIEKNIYKQLLKTNIKIYSSE